MRAFVAAHRFRLTLAACVAALILMTGVIHATVGLHVAWNATAGPGR